MHPFASNCALRNVDLSLCFGSRKEFLMIEFFSTFLLSARKRLVPF